MARFLPPFYDMYCYSESRLLSYVSCPCQHYLISSEHRPLALYPISQLIFPSNISRIIPQKRVPRQTFIITHPRLCHTSVYHHNAIISVVGMYHECEITTATTSTSITVFTATAVSVTSRHFKFPADDFRFFIVRLIHYRHFLIARNSDNYECE